MAPASSQAVALVALVALAVLGVPMPRSTVRDHQNIAGPELADEFYAGLQSYVSEGSRLS